MMTAETIGFIGVGTMGQPMARCLVTAGFALIVNDIHGAIAEAFATEIGATVAPTPKNVAKARLNPGPGQDHTDLIRWLEQTTKTEWS